jgi:16S rRNA (guanine966-N2)-methyltransferase
VQRIFGGRLKGKAIYTLPKLLSARPTMAKVRESIFQRLEDHLGHDWSGIRFLDGFAGSGIMGFEALSRGANYVLAVERDANQTGVLVRQAKMFEIGPEQFRVMYRNLESVVSKPPPEGQAFDLAFLDPPYGAKTKSNKLLIEGVIAHMAKNGWFAPEALLIVEQAKDESPLFVPTLEGLLEFDYRLYGGTRIGFCYFGRATEARAT